MDAQPLCITFRVVWPIMVVDPRLVVLLVLSGISQLKRSTLHCVQVMTVLTNNYHSVILQAL